MSFDFRHGFQRTKRSGLGGEKRVPKNSATWGEPSGVSRHTGFGWSRVNGKTHRVADGLVSVGLRSLYFVLIGICVLY